MTSPLTPVLSLAPAEVPAPVPSVDDPALFTAMLAAAIQAGAAPPPPPAATVILPLADAVAEEEPAAEGQEARAEDPEPALPVPPSGAQEPMDLAEESVTPLPRQRGEPELPATMDHKEKAVAAPGVSAPKPAAPAPEAKATPAAEAEHAPGAVASQGEAPDPAAPVRARAAPTAAPHQAPPPAPSAVATPARSEPPMAPDPELEAAAPPRPPVAPGRPGGMRESHTSLAPDLTVRPVRPGRPERRAGQGSEEAPSTVVSNRPRPDREARDLTPAPASQLPDPAPERPATGHAPRVEEPTAHGASEPSGPRCVPADAARPEEDREAASHEDPAGGISREGPAPLPRLPSQAAPPPLPTASPLLPTPARPIAEAGTDAREGQPGAQVIGDMEDPAPHAAPVARGVGGMPDTDAPEAPGRHALDGPRNDSVGASARAFVATLGEILSRPEVRDVRVTAGGPARKAGSTARVEKPAPPPPVAPVLSGPEPSDVPSKADATDLSLPRPRAPMPPRPVASPDAPPAAPPGRDVSNAPAETHRAPPPRPSADVPGFSADRTAPDGGVHTRRAIQPRPFVPTDRQELPVAEAGRGPARPPRPAEGAAEPAAASEAGGRGSALGLPEAPRLERGDGLAREGDVRQARNLREGSLEPDRPAGAADRVTLQLSGADGRQTRIRVAVLGDQIRATILPPDAEAARELEHRMDELQAALASRGYAEAKVTVQAARAEAALPWGGAPLTARDQTASGGTDQPPGDQRQGTGRRDEGRQGDGHRHPHQRPRERDPQDRRRQ